MSDIHQKIDQYYTDKIKEHGAVPQGVDWNGIESQTLRFDQQALLFQNETASFSVNDYGCGYGSFAQYLSTHYKNFDYHGFDLSQEMIDNALTQCADIKNANFQRADKPNKIRDYSVSSGIFNVQMEIEDGAWKEYIKTTLENMSQHSEKGFCFNILTSYSDKEYMRDYLHYADPCFWFDYCKKNFSRNVTLLHDYELYEFTILVRK